MKNIYGFDKTRSSSTAYKAIGSLGVLRKMSYGCLINIAALCKIPKGQKDKINVCGNLT